MAATATTSSSALRHCERSKQPTRYRTPPTLQANLTAGAATRVLTHPDGRVVPRPGLSWVDWNAFYFGGTACTT